MAVGCLVGASIAGFIDDIKLANAARKGTRSDIDFAKYGRDLLGGCVVGALFAGFGAVVDAIAGSAAAGVSVFWSGSGAEAAAAEWAAANGAKTLGMSALGQAVDTVTRGWAYNLARPLWQYASRKAAQGAAGDVHVFQGASGVNVDSIWAQTEWKALLENTNVGRIIFHIVGAG
jgi:hypothetical protein